MNMILLIEINLSELERLKLIIVKGTVMKPNLTFNELKCLGRSSEGFVHGNV